jgi:glutamine phosphoribosylpyrophosphate amidotransferase
MTDETGRSWIVHNGEIYNFRQLREELAADGHQFRSTTDTEFVMQDYPTPLARPEFFTVGFCLDVLGLHRQGLLDAVSKWEDNVHGFFNLLALEIWGRLFFLDQPVEMVTEQLLRLCCGPKEDSQVNAGDLNRNDWCEPQRTRTS